MDKTSDVKAGLPARRAALALLAAVLSEGKLLSTVTEDPKGPLAALDGPDRARAQRLALSTLRRIEPADRVLAPLLRKVPPVAVRLILSQAVCELSDGAAAHAVVNAAVTLTRESRKTEHLAGLVNAVLRKLPSGDPLAGQPVPKLPRWLRQPLVHVWGRDVVAAIEDVQSRPAPLDLTPHGALLPEGLALPTGSLRLSAPAQVTALPGYAEGHWWVQDAAAALPARLLAAQRGERVLDLCAAPGGKTLQLAAAGAEVTALDISAPRLERLRANLARTGLTAQIVIADALTWTPDAPFDAVLLDAPCSATGTIRRHPDLPFVKDGSELPDLQALQARLIDRALGLLRPGGRLVYATCSLLPAEGEDQITAALARHPGLEVLRPALPGVPDAWITPEGGLRLRPDHWADLGGMDGFYLAALRPKSR